MARQNNIEVSVGFASHAGSRPDNQDFAGAHLGSVSDRTLQGVVVALADGVGGAKGGRIAAELAVRNFLDGYRAQNPLPGIGAAAMRAMSGFNLWLHGQAHNTPEMLGAATTFTGMVLRGREAVVIHIGDSRAWHLRAEALTLLTEDHISLTPSGNPVLLRALGLEPHLRLDMCRQSLEEQDRLLLTSDGVHGVLSSPKISKLLAARQSPQADADAIVSAAIAAGSSDNATAMIVDIVALAAVDHDALAAEIDGLPLLPPPVEGQTVDGFKLVKQLGEGSHARLFLARDGENVVVLKFPKTSLLSEEGARLAFLRESFLGRRVESPFVGRTLALSENRQSCLYIAMPFYPGETLEERIARGRVPFEEAVAIAIKLSRGVAALHRLGVVHRDIKPGNVILVPHAGLRLIDLGIARVPQVKELPEKETPGTVNFMAPELFNRHPGDAISDQFALGVSVYRLFTGRYPYGEAEPNTRPQYGPPIPPSRYRPDMSARLEAAIMKAISLDRDDRFADVEELIYQIETGAPMTVARRPIPLLNRNPLRLWQMISLLLLTALLFVLLRYNR